MKVLFFAIPILVIMITGIAVAQENSIPSWVKNIAIFWGEDKVSDTEFINAMQYLIQNEIISVDSQNFEGFTTVKGDLFMILYPEEIMKNPLSTDGRLILDIQPLFAFDKNKMHTYEEIGNLDKNHNAVFVYPTFTQSAYQEPLGFYAYYRGECDDCTTIELKHDFAATFSSSGNAAVILHLLGYEFITDIDIDQNPSILEKYDKVILLHNEYVTRNQFDAITSHPNVIYLYPNALYAEISVDYSSNEITLVRGHNYPDPAISNGFDWEFDNTHPYEYDTECKTWDFYEIDNGMMLNCYPEHIIFKDAELLHQIKKF